MTYTVYRGEVSGRRGQHALGERSGHPQLRRHGGYDRDNILLHHHGPQCERGHWTAGGERSIRRSLRDADRIPRRTVGLYRLARQQFAERLALT